MTPDACGSCGRRSPCGRRWRGWSWRWSCLVGGGRIWRADWATAGCRSTISWALCWRWFGAWAWCPCGYRGAPPVGKSPRGARGRRRGGGARQAKVGFPFPDRALFDLGAEPVSEVGDAVLHDVFRGAGAGGDEHRLGALEPRGVDLGHAVDQISGPASAARNLSVYFHKILLYLCLL